LAPQEIQHAFDEFHWPFSDDPHLRSTISNQLEKLHGSRPETAADDNVDLTPRERFELFYAMAFVAWIYDLASATFLHR
jgi:hypothetical protein